MIIKYNEDLFIIIFVFKTQKKLNGVKWYICNTLVYWSIYGNKSVNIFSKIKKKSPLFHLTHLISTCNFFVDTRMWLLLFILFWNQTYLFCRAKVLNQDFSSSLVMFSNMTTIFQHSSTSQSQPKYVCL